MDSQEGRSSRPVLSLEDQLLNCDFTLTFLDVLRIVTEIMAPSTVEKLQLLSSPDTASAKSEVICLLDFLETEMIFIEFQRFLLRMVDSKTSADPELARHLPLSKRFEGFMHHIFL